MTEAEFDRFFDAIEKCLDMYDTSPWSKYIMAIDILDADSPDINARRAPQFEACSNPGIFIGLTKALPENMQLPNEVDGYPVHVGIFNWNTQQFEEM